VSSWSVAKSTSSLPVHRHATRPRDFNKAAPGNCPLQSARPAGGSGRSHVACDAALLSRRCPRPSESQTFARRYDTHFGKVRREVLPVTPGFSELKVRTADFQYAIRGAMLTRRERSFVNVEKGNAAVGMLPGYSPSVSIWQSRRSFGVAIHVHSAASTASLNECRAARDSERFRTACYRKRLCYGTALAADKRGLHGSEKQNG